MRKCDWNKLIMAFTILSVAWFIGLFVTIREQDRLDETQKHLEELSLVVTGSLCLQAYAPEDGANDEKSLIVAYVDGTQIDLDTKLCRQAVAKARKDIEGD